MPRIEELTTILDCSFGNPCIDQTAFGPTASSFYWSPSTHYLLPGYAWRVNFSNGVISPDVKNLYSRVRAVRGGL